MLVTAEAMLRRGNPMTTARKALIVRKASPVSEMASEVREGLDAIADALTHVAGALCYEAATRYSGTAGEQRQIAAVMFHTAQKRFGGVKYDGTKVESKDIPELDALWRRLTGGRMRK